MHHWDLAVLWLLTPDYLAPLQMIVWNRKSISMLLVTFSSTEYIHHRGSSINIFDLRYIFMRISVCCKQLCCSTLKEVQIISTIATVSKHFDTSLNMKIYEKLFFSFLGVYSTTDDNVFRKVSTSFGSPKYLEKWQITRFLQDIVHTQKTKKEILVDAYVNTNIRIF